MKAEDRKPIDRGLENQTTSEPRNAPSLTFCDVTQRFAKMVRERSHPLLIRYLQLVVHLGQLSDHLRMGE